MPFSSTAKNLPLSGFLNVTLPFANPACAQPSSILELVTQPPSPYLHKRHWPIATQSIHGVTHPKILASANALEANRLPFSQPNHRLCVRVKGKESGHHHHHHHPTGLRIASTAKWAGAFPWTLSAGRKFPSSFTPANAPVSDSKDRGGVPILLE
jgi:hypothetical protein